MHGVVNLVECGAKRGSCQSCRIKAPRLTSCIEVIETRKTLAMSRVDIKGTSGRLRQVRVEGLLWGRLLQAGASPGTVLDRISWEGISREMHGEAVTCRKRHRRGIIQILNTISVFIAYTALPLFNTGYLYLPQIKKNQYSKQP